MFRAGDQLARASCTGALYLIAPLGPAIDLDPPPDRRLP
jgi:hypothetical protein